MKPFPKKGTPNLANHDGDSVWYYNADEVDVWREELRKYLQEIIDCKAWEHVPELKMAHDNQVAVAREVLEALT